MPLKRLILFISVLLLLGIFLWAATNINREVEISSYTTTLSGLSEAQVENLQIAAAKVDGTVIKPGELFSFNEIVGERLRRWGYKGAPTIYQGQMVYTPGGGLCQLVSTIYNAALLGGMEIIERTPHLWTINSVGPGRDATTLYGKIDLKFRNNYDVPVKIGAEVSDNRVFARLFSTQKLDQQITLEVQTLKVIPAPRYPHYPQTSSAQPSSFKQGRDGYKVRVYRYYKKDDKLIKRELISVDEYEPVPGNRI